MTSSHTKMLPVGKAAKKCARETWERFEKQAPRTLRGFDDIQRELIIEWMALTFLDGVKDGVERLHADLKRDALPDDEQTPDNGSRNSP